MSDLTQAQREETPDPHHRGRADPAQAGQLPGECWERSRDTKGDDWLFQLTKYRPDAKRDMRLLSYKNFQFSCGICLDFDGGTVSPDEFIRIFWTDAGSHTKHSFIICNTFSTSPLKPHKFRVVLPFNGTADVETYKAIFEKLVQRLVDAGHPGIRIHEDSLNAVRSYLVPVTNSAHPASRLLRGVWTEAHGRVREICHPACRLRPVHPGQGAAALVQEGCRSWMSSARRGPSRGPGRSGRRRSSR